MPAAARRARFTAGAALVLAVMPSQGPAQEPAPPVAGARNVLYLNPVHLAKGNITLTYERFTAPRRSFKVMLSGSEAEDYVAVAADLNYYPAPPAPLNWFIGGSVLGYESPIVTGVPIF